MLSSFLIGITGASGSGKTSLLNAYSSAFGELTPSVISLDNYYHPIEKQSTDENGVVNFDLPTAFDIERCLTDLESLSNGIEVVQKEYNFNNDKAEYKEIVIKPSSLIFLEGIFVLYDRQLSSMANYHVYIKAEDSIRYKRRLKRDIIERGIPEEIVSYQWNNHVRIANEKYLIPYENEADIIINNSVHFQDDLNKSVLEIRKKLEIISNT